MTELSDRRAGPAGVGRPRDPGLDRSILAAARELLVEVGYQKTTITAIARRAGVGTAAIYRRWSTKESIIEDAVFGLLDPELPAAGPNLRADLLAWTEWFLSRIAEPATRAALPGLLSAYQREQGAYGMLVSRAEEPARAAFVGRVAAALPGRPAAEASAAADGAFDLLVAATIVRGLTSGLAGADEFCARTTESLALLVEADRSRA